MGNGYSDDGTMYTLNTIEKHSVLYSPEHPSDSDRGGYRPVCVMATSCWNAPFTDGQISPALCARAGTGGNQLPLVVLVWKAGEET